MKKIEAIVQPDVLEKVKATLYDAGIYKMTVHKVRGCGQQRGYTESYRSKIFKVNLLEKIKLEIAVNEEFVESCIAAIIEGARTDTIGDGKIFITDLDRCIRIRTGEEGRDAIG